MQPAEKPRPPRSNVSVLNDLRRQRWRWRVPLRDDGERRDTVTVTAADDIGVTSVQFLLDGAPLGIADTEAPYEAEWGTTTAANGAHTISAVAQDAAGHVTTATR